MEYEKLEEDLMNIRPYYNPKTAPAIPAELDHKTRVLCHEILQKRPLSIPRFIWAALIFLTILTAIFALPVLKELRSEEVLSIQAIVMISLCIQNAVMLFFTPVLIRKFRAKKDNWTFNGYRFKTF